MKGRPNSPRHNDHRKSLVENQEHPFKPEKHGHQHDKRRDSGNSIPYQSIKKGVPTLNPPSSVEMTPQTFNPMQNFTQALNHQPSNFNGQSSYQNMPPLQPQQMQMQPQQMQMQMQPQPQMQPMPMPMQPMPMPMQPMQPMMQPMQPMPMAPAFPMAGAMDPNIPMDANMSAAGQNFFQSLGGWGNYYYNALDPALAAKKNTPIPVAPSWHIPVLVLTILFIAGIGVAIVGMGSFLKQLYLVIIVILLPFLLYLGITYKCSSIRGYLFNLKKFDEYQTIYNRMKQGRGFFVFHIECYHYKTTRTRKGGSSRHKVVTHTAREEFNPRECIDDSGEVEGLKIATQYAFCKYLKRFYFSDPASENRFISAFNRFVSRNRRDTHQTYRYVFDVHGFQQEVGFCATGDIGHSKTLFLIFMFLGLAFPYSLFFERSVSRFEINILKRLTS